jgi:hypothetical protein
MWRRRSRFNTFRRSQRIVTAEEYWNLKRTKSKGQEVTITLRCDGAKMHKMTFYDRGSVVMHNHSLKAERALYELAHNEYTKPKCIRMLEHWKDRYYYASPPLPKLLDVNAFRSTIQDLHRANQSCSDADGLDLDHHDRLQRMVSSWATNIYAKITKVYKLNDSHNHSNDNYITNSHIDTSKLRLVLNRKQGIGAPIAPEAKRVQARFDLNKLEKAHRD